MKTHEERRSGEAGAPGRRSTVAAAGRSAGAAAAGAPAPGRETGTGPGPPGEESAGMRGVMEV